VLGAAGEEQVIGIVRRGRLGAWETYQPSQLPLGAWVMSDELDYEKVAESCCACCQAHHCCSR
jgi:hypothetical protein